MTPLANSTYRTLAFFNAQDIPLTLIEIGNYLVAAPALPTITPTLSEIGKVLSGELRTVIDRQQGLYFLRGRSAIVAKRMRSYKLSLSRFRQVRHAAYGLRFIPFLRAVAVSGSQALLASDADSDIDFFVIVKKNRIWLARVLISAYFQILGQRRYRAYIAGRVCLNHYLCESTSISADQNLYTAVEYASLVPVLGYQELQKFWRCNPWIKSFLPFAVSDRPSTFVYHEISPLAKLLEWLFEHTVAGSLNYLLGRYQKQRIRAENYILISEDELSFHPGSRGQQVLRSYEANVK